MPRGCAEHGVLFSFGREAAHLSVHKLRVISDSQTLPRKPAFPAGAVGLRANRIGT